MGRWEPDAPGRLTQAALELFVERGYEQTTVLDIAERAGVTERTFFRHFADKREVLFDRRNAMQEAVVAAIAAAPETLPPLELAGLGMAAAGDFLEGRREHAGRRAGVIAANPSLQERELLKLAALSDAVATELRQRGVPAPEAGVAAEAGVGVFRRAFERWVADPSAPDLATCVRDSLATLRALAAARPRGRGAVTR